MHIHEKIGMLYELSFVHRLTAMRNFIAVSNVDLYSYALKKQSPVDVVIIYGNHVFILETKSFTKQLSGTMTDRNWTLLTGDTRKPLFNPVLQAREKVRAIKNRCYLFHKDIQDIVWHYYVIVPDRCVVYTDSTQVLKESAFIELILSLNTSNFDYLKIAEQVIF